MLLITSEASRRISNAHRRTNLQLIDHFTVLCSVTRPLNESEAVVDLALIQTSLLFLCKSCCYNANEFLFT